MVAAGLTSPDPPDDEAGSDGALEHLGIPGRDLQRMVATRCLVQAREHLQQLLMRVRRPADHA